MPSLTIAVAGASGSDAPFSQSLGNKISHQLLKQGAGVKILTRKEKVDTSKIAELRAAGAEIVVVDYAAAETLDAALKGIDIVVCCLSWGGASNQKPLADAAIRQNVKLYLPSEWGNSTLKEPEGSPYFGNKVFRESLEGKLPTLLIWHGPFAQILGSFVGPHNGVIELPAGGKQPISTTSIDDVADYVGYILTHVPTENLSNRYLFIEGSRATFEDMANVYVKRDPSIKTKIVPVDEIHQRWKAGNFHDFFTYKWHSEGRGVDATEEQVKEALSLYPGFKPRPIFDFL